MLGVGLELDSQLSVPRWDPGLVSTSKTRKLYPGASDRHTLSGKSRGRHTLSGKSCGLGFVFFLSFFSFLSFSFLKSSASLPPSSGAI